MRRRRSASAVVAIVLALACRKTPQPWARESHLTRSLERDAKVTSLRRDEPAVYFVVTLADAPVGDRLRLHCEWRAPSGRIAHQSDFETRQITRSEWPTHCKMALSEKSETGTWSVALLRDGSTLANGTLLLE